MTGVPIRVVDVSQYNQGVDWARLRRELNVRAAFVRVFSGAAVDKTAPEHRRAARAHGLQVYAYYVASPTQDPKAGRALAHELCAGPAWDRLDPLHAFWALDWEVAGLSERWAEGFGQPPVLYRSEAEHNYFPAADQWVAAWRSAPIPQVAGLVAWQYTSSLTGYSSGRLDLSLATGRLAHHLASADHPPPPPDPTPPGGGGGGHHHHHTGGKMTLKDYAEKTDHRLAALEAWQDHVRDELHLQDTLHEFRARLERIEGQLGISADVPAAAPEKDSPAPAAAEAPTPAEPAAAAEAEPQAAEAAVSEHPTGWVPGQGDNPNPADQPAGGE